MAEGELRAWLEEVKEDSKVDVTGHIDALLSHGIVKYLLTDISSEDWGDIIKPIGHRITLRDAAANVYLKAEMVNLKSQMERLRSNRDELVTESAGIREELEKSQLELSRIDSDMEKTELDKESASSKNREAISEKIRLEKETTDLASELQDLNSKIEAAVAQKAKAVQEKEDAIQRAIQVGVSAQKTSTGPAGFAFNGLPPSASIIAPPSAGAMMAPAPVAMAPMPVRIPLDQQPWYHGSISRPACEQLLLGGQCAPGSYLIRVSTRGDGAYSLSVRELQMMKVKHFKIERAGPQWKLSLKVPDNKYFPDIMQLISHYKSIGPFSGIQLINAAPNGRAAPAQQMMAPMMAAPAPGGGAVGCCKVTGWVGKDNDKFCGVCGTKNPGFRG